jgi:long-subunit acyl-CoA synthetase (AMP-forming)
MQAKLMLDYVYANEVAHRNTIYLTQPLGGDRVANYTWGQTLDQARRMAAHLKSLGFEPGARVAILSKNCAHFILAELAIWMAGGTTVAIFPTETEDTVRYVLEHSGASLLFVGKLDNWASQRAAVPSTLPCITLPLAPPDALAQGNPSWDEIVGSTAPLTENIQRGANDLCMICYTSGSTGQPKGVMHSFGRATQATLALAATYRSQKGLTSGPIRALSYLPLAHILERAWLGYVSLMDGEIQLFFAESLDTFVKDLQRARPTVFMSVPRLWLKFQQGVFTKMPPKKLDRLLSIPFLGRIVARKVLTGLGLDQTLVATSGSAPIPADLIRWYRRLGLNLLEGYGMTEDFACSHGSTAEFCETGYVGIPIPGVEVRLSDEGEILVKSPGQLVGYFKRPDLDAEVFTEDGFFRTGDRGERRANGLLKITGRVKELFKTSKGKYVAPAPIENLLNAHPLVELSMVSGVGQPAPFGMLVLAEGIRPQLGDPAVRAQVTLDLQRLLHDVNAQLADYEQLDRLVVASQPWTIENGLLTPTMKIKRSRIEKSQEQSLVGWYDDPERVVWA